MATYKVIDADQLDADMSSVADTIRSKSGTSETLAWPDGFKSAVESIEGGEVGTCLWTTATAFVSAVQDGWLYFTFSSGLPEVEKIRAMVMNNRGSGDEGRLNAWGPYAESNTYASSYGKLNHNYMEFYVVVGTLGISSSKGIRVEFEPDGAENVVGVYSDNSDVTFGETELGSLFVMSILYEV